jgi:hypothetical protein
MDILNLICVQVQCQKARPTCMEIGFSLGSEIVFHPLIFNDHSFTGDGMHDHGHMEFRLRNLFLCILFKFNIQYS